jgi:ribosome-associated protein
MTTTTRVRRKPVSPALKLAKLCAAAALDKKADDVLVLDLRGLSSVTDFFVIVSGTSEPHLKAIADEIEKQAIAIGDKPRAVDGFPASHWVVMDFTDVIVHIFHPRVREHYALENLWGDAPKVKV